MKKNYFFAILIASAGLFAQTKTSGVVSLGTRMTLRVDKNNSISKAIFTITGPSDRWFGVSYRDFGGSLSNQDCILVNSSTAVSDAMFPGGAAATIDAVQNISVISNTITGTSRTIVVERNLVRAQTSDYTINYSHDEMDISWAIGPAASFNITSKHLNSSTLDRSFATLTFSVLGNESFNKKLESLSVYPNPVSNVLHLQNQNLLPISVVKIYNTNAQMVKEITLNSTNELYDIDVSNLSSGNYFLEINNENDKSVKKIQIK